MTNMLGHNFPDDITTLLEETYTDLMQRYDELIEAWDRMPESCNDDETATKMTDFAGQLMVCIKKAEDARKIEKEPHLNAGRAVDSFFGDMARALERRKKMISEMVGNWQWRKQEVIR